MGGAVEGGLVCRFWVIRHGSKWVFLFVCFYLLCCLKGSGVVKY